MTITSSSLQEQLEIRLVKFFEEYLYMPLARGAAHE